MAAIRNFICCAAALLALTPIAGWAATPTPAPTATLAPTPAPTPTPIAAPTPTAVPTPQGQLSIDPSAAPPAATLHLIGSGFPAGKTFTVLFDSRPFATIAADAGGNFAKDVMVPDFATGPEHQICVQEPAGTICGGFRLLTAPSPSPSPTASPSPSPSPSTSPSPSPTSVVGHEYSNPTASGGSPLASLTRPPGIFFPILLLLALVLGSAYWYFVMREPAPVNEVTILHRAAPERTGGFEREGPALEPPPARAPAPAEPIVYESPTATPSPRPPAVPHQPPAGADVPPDLPEATD